MDTKLKLYDTYAEFKGWTDSNGPEVTELFTELQALLPIADTRVLAPKADVVVFLTRWRKTPQHAVEAAFRMLQGSGAQLAGVALTQVDMKSQAKYSYGDPGYYYAEYKRYYTS